VPLLAFALACIVAAPAGASKEPSGSKARAIKKAFRKGHEGETKINRILLSTVNPRFAAVSYAITIDEVRARGYGTAPTLRGATKKYPAPSPEILKKKKGGKWKAVPTAPKKVRKDLKVKDPKSSIQISGEHTASLTRPASCTDSHDFYGAGVYDPGTDTYLSVQIFNYSGHRLYPALGVGSVAGLYGNSGTVLVYETGQGNDAFSPSGIIHVDEGWGIIDATMARVPDEGGTYPQSVTVRGTWDCR
jgi:hypothetical protein